MFFPSSLLFIFIIIWMCNGHAFPTYLDYDELKNLRLTSFSLSHQFYICVCVSVRFFSLIGIVIRTRLIVFFLRFTFNSEIRCKEMSEIDTFVSIHVRVLPERWMNNIEQDVSILEICSEAIEVAANICVRNKCTCYPAHKANGNEL